MRTYLIVSLVALSSTAFATDDIPRGKNLAHFMSVLSYAERYCLPVLKVNDAALRKFVGEYPAVAIVEAKAFDKEENAATEARIKHDGLKPFCKSIMTLAGPNGQGGLDVLIDYRR